MVKRIDYQIGKFVIIVIQNLLVKLILLLFKFLYSQLCINWFYLVKLMIKKLLKFV